MALQHSTFATLHSEAIFIELLKLTVECTPNFVANLGRCNKRKGVLENVSVCPASDLNMTSFTGRKT
jgi:hypothetical protein